MPGLRWNQMPLQNLLITSHQAAVSEQAPRLQQSNTATPCNLKGKSMEISANHANHAVSECKGRVIK